MNKKKNKKSLRMSAVLLPIIVTVVMVTALALAGNLEPTAPPGPTMKTLNEIPPTWSQTLPASDRFEFVLNNEAVLDKETGLVWARDATMSDGVGQKTWEDAVIYCRNLVIGNRKGWRLPTVEELASLVDPSESSPALPPGYSSFFFGPIVGTYWSSTSYEGSTASAWIVTMGLGTVTSMTKSNSRSFWPVRGGSGPILVPHTP